MASRFLFFFLCILLTEVESTTTTDHVFAHHPIGLPTSKEQSSMSPTKRLIDLLTR
jgi:hypothetical protein